VSETLHGSFIKRKNITDNRADFTPASSMRRPAVFKTRLRAGAFVDEPVWQDTDPV
jgi:hypothetical protein